MTQYIVYRLAPSGSYVTHVFDAVDDAEAIGRASALALEADSELWQGFRQVAKMPLGGPVTVVPTRPS